MDPEDNIYEYQEKFQINPELQKKFEHIKSKIDKLKQEVIKKHKEVIGISLLPNISPLRFSSYMDAGIKKEEKLEEENKDKINLLFLIDDQDKKEMFEIKHKISKSVEEIAKSIDINFLIKTKLVFEDDDCIRQIETHIWGLTDKRVILKQGIVIPIHRIHEVKL